MPCLDSHYSCGPNSHLVKFGYNFCHLSRNKYADKLDHDGQTYLEHSSTCLMRRIHDQLWEPIITAKFSCTNLLSMFQTSFVDCLKNPKGIVNQNEKSSICSVICPNLEPMINFFLNINYGSINLHEILREVGEACGANIEISNTHTVPSILISICLDRNDTTLSEDITNVMRNSRFHFKDYDWG